MSGGGSQESDDVLEEALSRLLLLADASRVLGSSLDERTALARLAQLLVPQLADWCAADLLNEQLNRIAVVQRDQYASRDTNIEGLLPAPSQLTDAPLERVLRGAGPLLITEFPAPHAASSPLHATHLRLYERLGADTAVVAPLRSPRGIHGMLTLVRTDPANPLTEADLPFIEELAQRAGLTVENARLYRAQQQAARDFQLSLLPRLPEPDNIQLAACYTPAEEEFEVGGDWYDSFVLPDGATALVAGDVAGHDLQAAVRMSQVRNLLRSLAFDRQEPPGMIMRRLDQMVDQLTDAEGATAIYGRIEGLAGGTWQFHWTNAGHPPPLLVTHDGDTTLLEDGHGPMLGVLPDSFRPNGNEPLPPRSTLLLYTDGLVERPGESLSDGLVRLCRHAAALAHAGINEFCNELSSRLTGDVSIRDDIALLAVRLPEAHY